MARVPQGSLCLHRRLALGCVQSILNEHAKNGRAKASRKGLVLRLRKRCVHTFLCPLSHSLSLSETRLEGGLTLLPSESCCEHRWCPSQRQRRGQRERGQGAIWPLCCFGPHASATDTILETSATEVPRLGSRTSH